MNFSKSKVFGVGATLQETVMWSLLLECEPYSLPFNNLGVPVGANMNLIRNWQPVVGPFQAKLSSWKAKALSFGGRVTLIKPVLRNLPTNFFLIFVAPISDINILEIIQRQFLWGWGEISKQKKIN